MPSSKTIKIDPVTDTLRINEIFYSLQGEARTVGLPTIFIRLTGCPLRCQYCDTEYAFYVYSGGAWKLLADEDSANTDANTINVTLTQAGGTANTNIGTMSDGARVTMVTVKVTTPFDTTDATLTIGDSGDNDRLMSDNEIDLTSAGQYTATPGYQYTTGSDQTVIAYFNVGTSTTGTVEVAVTYV